MIKKFIKLSAVTQFAAGKVSILISSTTLATVLSMKFNLPWTLAMVGVAVAGVATIAIIYFSGWIKAEYAYNSELMDIGERLKRIEKKLECD